MTAGTALTNEIQLAIAERYPRIFLYRNNRVDAMVAGVGGRARRVTAGIDGQADLSGVIPPGGRRLEIEIKAGRDRQSEKQKTFQETIERAGGIYILARSLSQCIQDLECRMAGRSE